jgi:hypothetical protein
MESEVYGTIMHISVSSVNFWINHYAIFILLKSLHRFCEFKITHMAGVQAFDVSSNNFQDMEIYTSKM